VKGKIYAQEGQYEQALAELKIALALSGGFVHLEAMQAHTLALAGASDQALEIAKQLEDRSTRTYIWGVDIAAIYCGLGQTDAAMHWLKRAYQNHDNRNPLFHSHQLCTGAPCSHQRTWVREDGAKPHQRSVFSSSPRTAFATKPK
jgi:tetratricopeptide (TPR) repeat protein